MVSATFTGNSLVVTFEENPENSAELRYEIEYYCANKMVPHVVDQSKSIGVNPANGMRIYSDTLLYEEHVSAGLTRTPTIKLYTVDSNDDRSGAFTVEASNPPPSAPSFQSEVSHNLIIMNFYPGTDSDFEGYHVWASETSPVAKTSENEKAFGPNPIVSFKAEPDTTYYVRYSGYDAFGDDDAIENEVEITTPLDPSQSLFDQLDEELAEAQQQLTDLIDTYGSTSSASASALAAQEAKDDAIDAATAAGGSATSSQASALVAIKAATASIPTTFEDGVTYFASNNGGTIPANMTPNVHPTYGPNLTNTLDTTWGAVSHKTRQPTSAGKKWKVRALIGNATGASPTATLSLECWPSATGGTRIDAPNVAVSITSTDPKWYEYTFTSATDGFVTPTVLLNYPAPHTSIQRIYALELLDVDALEQAASYANIASGAAVDASASESSAATNASLTAGYKAGLINSLSDTFPKTLNPDLYGTGLTSGPTDAQGFVPSSWIAPDRSYIEIPSGSYEIGARGLVPVNEGDVFRLTADIEQTIVGSGTKSHSMFYVRYLDADMNHILSVSAGAGNGMNLEADERGVLSKTIGYKTSGIDVDYNNNTADVKYMRFLLLVNRIEGGTSNVSGSVARIHSFYVEDERQQANSIAQANIATDQATLATGAAASATSNTALTATYMDAAQKAATASMPSTFEDGVTFFKGDSVQTTPSNMTPNVHPTNGPNLTNTVNTTYGTVGTKARQPTTAGKKWKVRALIGHATGPVATAYLRLETWPSATGGTRTNIQNFAVTVPSTTPTWFEYTFTSAGDGFVNSAALLNYPTYTTIQRIYALELIDVDAVEAAAASAAIATAQAAVATDKAAAAQTSADLAASVSQGALSGNPGFDSYPSGTTGQLPTSWGNWSGSASMYRVADSLGGYALRMPGGAGANAGVYFGNVASAQISTGGYYVIEATVTLNSGTFVGAGVSFQPFNSNSAVIQTNLNLVFVADPDVTNTVVGNGTVGRTYQFSKMVKVTAAGAHGFRLYAMGHWAGAGSTATANDITWSKCLVRPATTPEIEAGVALPALEATVTSQASVLATHTTQLASRLERVAAGPSSATLKMTALNSSGGAASQIALEADEIKMGSTGGGLTISGGVATFKGELNVGGTTGGRLNMQKDVMKIYNPSGTLKIQIGNLSL